MTLAQKSIFSLVLAAVLVGGAAVLAHTGIFDLIENHFYNPAAGEALVRQAAKDAKLLSGVLSGLYERFSFSLSEPAVRRSLLSGQGADDIDEMSGIYSLLHKSVPALQSVRFVDSGGERMYFSTYPADIVNSDTFPVVYRDYHNDPASLPFHDVHVPVQEYARFVLDTARDRMIFSFPLDDSLGVYRGIALFAVSTGILTEAIAEDIAFSADPPGFICGLPAESDDAILAGVSAVWAEGYRSVIPIDLSDTRFILVSAPADQGCYFGRIYSGTVLAFPQPIKRIVVITVFLTVFLILFFLFNFKQASPDSKAVITEHNGIHFINSEAVNGEENIDKNFVNLVESVVGKKQVN